MRSRRAMILVTILLTQGCIMADRKNKQRFLLSTQNRKVGFSAK